MSFFSKFVKPYTKGEKNFVRGRAAETRRQFDKAMDYFKASVEGFDEHLADKAAKGDEVRPSHLVMAGIGYTRLGRYEDALRVLDECIERKDIPAAFLHAGFSAAKLGQADKAVEYWKGTPSWDDQRIIANVLKEQIKAISKDGDSALEDACDAVIKGVYEQDQINKTNRNRQVNDDKYSVYKEWY